MPNVKPSFEVARAPLPARPSAQVDGDARADPGRAVVDDHVDEALVVTGRTGRETDRKLDDIAGRELAVDRESFRPREREVRRAGRGAAGARVRTVYPAPPH